MAAQKVPIQSAEGYPARVSTFDGIESTDVPAVVGLPGPWMRVSGCVYANAVVRADAFNGTIALEGSMDGKTMDGAALVASVTVNSIAANKVGPIGVPYLRLNVTAMSAGTITDAWIYGYGGK